MVESTDGVGCWVGQSRIAITLLVDSRGSTLLHAFQILSTSCCGKRVQTTLLRCLCRVASSFFTSHLQSIRNAKHKYCTDKTGSTDCTIHSVLALLKRNKQVPFREFRLACSSKSVKILSNPNTAKTNSFDRINSAARTRSSWKKND